MPGSVALVNAADAAIRYVGDAHVIRALWSGFEDPESGLVDYAIAVGTVEAPELFLSYHGVGCGQSRDGGCDVRRFETHSLSIPQLTEVVVSLRAVNGAGAMTVVQSAIVTGEPVRLLVLRGDLQVALLKEAPTLV